MIVVRFYVAAYDFDTPQEFIFGLFRWYQSEKGLFLEQWSAISKRWIPAPQLIAATGIGGCNNYEIISYERAVRLIVEFGGSAAHLLPPGGVAEVL